MIEEFFDLIDSHGMDMRIYDMLTEIGRVVQKRDGAAATADLTERLAEAMGGPGTTWHEIGIRPGEKLHEVLLPYDEARNTLEFESHFTVQPAFSWWKREDHEFEGGERGRAVANDFQYRSNSVVSLERVP